MAIQIEESDVRGKSTREETRRKTQVKEEFWPPQEDNGGTHMQK